MPYSPAPDPPRGMATVAVPLAATTIAGRTEQVPRLRRWIRELLAGRHPRVDDVELCLSEVVTNSLVHTESAEIAIAVFGDHGVVRAEVTDTGVPGVGPHVCGSSGGTDRERGRGLLLVDAISRGRWGTSAGGTTAGAPAGGGRLTWFELSTEDLPPAENVDTAPAGRPVECVDRVDLGASGRRFVPRPARTDRRDGCSDA